MYQSTYLDSGDCNWTCEFCDAFLWFQERLISRSTCRRPRYSHCCKCGRVVLPYPRRPPESIIRLFQESDFLTNIRAYNSMFSMTSFGAKVDDFINDGSAPCVFKVEGHIHHLIGSLCPPPNESPWFLQMYVYDTDNELSNRIGVFSDDGRSHIRQETVTLLMDVLATTNELVKLFRTAKDLCSSSDVSNFSIRLYSSHNAHSHDKPFSGSIGAIIPDEFQKRGLPHCHLLVWVKQTSVVTGPMDIDSFIIAEISNPDEDPLLYKVVTELMVHGPCGLVLPNSTCMNNGSCSKVFPKDFRSTTFFDKKGYVHYRRRPSSFTVNKNDLIVDSRYVVPYNRALCLHFMAHINVEYRGWSMLIKYLFRYISKGADRVRYKLTKSPVDPTIPNDTPSHVNEIQNFIDG
ncbi:uncharacterized protein LOC143623335 [Bidens hawaiensis]|uniref:uncharacterized protein LOC143623335 n=1 Tax=Bidens hawaiensis TaxID=980011 RepID=UPI00404A5FAC